MQTKASTGTRRTRGATEDPEAGWTFVETLIVIAIVLILTGSVGFMAFRYVDRARQVTARTQIEAFSLALNAYALDAGRYPSEQEGLDALQERPGSVPADRWLGPYMERSIPVDPWGNPYEYEVPGPHGLPFVVRSLGADGTPGGEGIDADISSAE